MRNLENDAFLDYGFSIRFTSATARQQLLRFTLSAFACLLTSSLAACE
jgi:hypothetical protein